MTTPHSTVTADVVLIGGGIMSATLAAMLTVSNSGLTILLLERSGGLASESSGPWNNAGTGHSGYCELNYMPDPLDGRKPARIADQFTTGLVWWRHLESLGLLDLSSFLTPVPHLDVVFGERDVAYLAQRFATLRHDPRFAEMEYTDDPAVIAGWAPLVMAGRDQTDGPIAATRHPSGTDVDFGALTKALVRIVTDHGGRVLYRHDVRALRRRAGGGWTIVARRDDSTPIAVNAGFVFVGAGGMALRLLQKARIPEVRGYAVLPVGAAFLRCDNPAVVGRHDAKVYGQAALGAPPMSVPHLDKRIIDGNEALLFGPYATFSTKLLKHGRLTDFFTTLRWHNLHVVAAAVFQNLALIRYLITELTASPRRKFRALQTYCPEARYDDWRLVAAGQRAQLVTPDRRRVGVLQQGTELVISADGSIAGLLGASPGASTAVSIMIDLVARCFPEISLPDDVTD